MCCTCVTSLTILDHSQSFGQCPHSMCHGLLVADHPGSPGVEMVGIVVSSDGSVAEADIRISCKLLGEKTVCRRRGDGEEDKSNG